MLAILGKLSLKMQKNPFEMINGIINGHRILLRPVCFDSKEYNKDYKKPDGNYIRPTVTTTTCPTCGSLINQIIGPNDDLSKPIIVNCDICTPHVVETIKSDIFTFKNPIKTGLVSLWDINPTAMDNFGINADFFDKKELDIKSKNIGQNSIVEITSGSLGPCLRKKDMWKSSNSNKPIERHADFFELVGDMVNESFVKQDNT